MEQINREVKPKAIFITGVAGFLGSTLAERLLDETSYHIIGVDNWRPYYPKALKIRNLLNLIKSSRFTLFETSFEDQGTWETVQRNFDIQAVVHLAADAGVRPSLANPHEYYQNNVMRTVTLLENMRASGVKNLLFTSSSSVYGGNKDLPFKESHATDRPLSPYAATKKAGEELVHSYCHLYGFRALALRLFTVYGPRQRPDLAIRKFMLAIHRDEPISLYGDGSSCRDYTYVGDVVDAYQSGIEKLREFADSRMETLNIGSGRTITLLEMIRHIENALGKSARLTFQPSHPADLDATFADISKAREQLGYQPKVDFFAGVCALRDWLFSDRIYQQDIPLSSVSVANWVPAPREKVSLTLNRKNRA